METLNPDDETGRKDTQNTIGRVASHRPTMDHNMLYISGENLKLRPFYAHEIGQKGVKCVKQPNIRKKQPKFSYPRV
jgi:hypothetical protein